MEGYVTPTVDKRYRPVLRAARVIRITRRNTDSTALELEVLEGPLRGERIKGLSYGDLGPAPEEDAEVLCNTVGLEMELGTGGVAVVLPAGGGEAPVNRDHFIKLPYTPLQFPAEPPQQAEDLAGSTIIVLPLHSHLTVACCAVADLRPEAGISFVWQEGGALPVAFSDTVRMLKERDLLNMVVSSGNCFGGDVEAPNLYAGLLAAAAVSDVILVGIGPGISGTGTAYGHGGMSAAIALNAASALGGDPVLAPRISRTDARIRHRGISHHTRSALIAALDGVRVAVPASATDLDLNALPDRHDYTPVSHTAAGLEERFEVTFESMGRSYQDDGVFFDAAAAAVALAFGGAA